jgi:hypothetical protein
MMRYRLRALLIVLAIGLGIPGLAIALRSTYTFSPPAAGDIFPPRPLAASDALPFILPAVYFAITITALLWWNSNRRHSH